MAFLSYAVTIIRAACCANREHISVYIYVLGEVAGTGGLIEHYVYYIAVPSGFVLVTFVEVLLQTLIFGQLPPDGKNDSTEYFTLICNLVKGSTLYFTLPFYAE